MSQRGRMKWMPAVVIDEIEDIKREDDVHADAEAMRKLVGYARVGRESKRLIRLDFSKKKPLPKIESYPMSKGGKKKNPFRGII